MIRIVSFSKRIGQIPGYRLGLEGAKELAKLEGLPLAYYRYSKRPKKLHPWSLDHGIDLANFRIAFEQAAHNLGLSVEVCRGEMFFKDHKNVDHVSVTSGYGSEKLPICPDTYYLLTTQKGRGHFFVEIDESTEYRATHKWRRKILGYKEYVLSGDFTKRYGGNPSTIPLRILTATPSLGRAQNLAKAAETYGPKEASQMFWFTPRDKITPQEVLTSPIWLRAGEITRRAIL